MTDWKSPTQEERQRILHSLANPSPDIARLEERSEALRVVWMKKRKDLRRAEEKEAKAKADYFNAHEAFVIARTGTLIGQATTFAKPTKKESEDAN